MPRILFTAILLLTIWLVSAFTADRSSMERPRRDTGIPACSSSPVRPPPSANR